MRNRRSRPGDSANATRQHRRHQAMRLGRSRCARSRIFRPCCTSSGSPGPAVVFWNITIRIVVAFLPGRHRHHRPAFIIDGVNRIRFHQPLPSYFWWLVGAEMALAVLIGILSRAVDYFDNLLADRYTHHVSVEVMRKAAALDVTVYEDPVFYDAWNARAFRPPTGWP